MREEQIKKLQNQFPSLQTGIGIRGSADDLLTLDEEYISLDFVRKKCVDKMKVKEAFSKLKKGGFLYKDTNGVVPSIVFSRGYNQAIEEVKKILKELSLGDE